MKKIVNSIFVGGIILFLTLGLINTIFFPDDINEYENRYANKVKAFSWASYLDGSFQSQFGDALNDQVPLSVTMKKNYNFLNASFENNLLSKILQKNEKQQYVSFKGGLMFGDYIVYETRDYSELQDYHSAKVKNIKKQVNNHSDIDFYVYYIEKDTDINFETEEKIGAYEYLQNAFNDMGIAFHGFKIDSFDEFCEYFYQTDHHWNCYGSYKAYKEIVKWMGITEDLVPIVDEHLLEYAFSGSKAAALGVNDIISEPFPAYEYQYPKMKVMIDQKEVEDYGAQSLYFSEHQGNITYGSFYGGDQGEIIFDTESPEKENLLIIGESYDNAILKLLASHYNRTYSVDLRNYEKTFGQPFSFTNYVEENEIDRVLLIGNIDYFTMEEFMLED